ncbi:MAG: hypothetical protein ACRDY6_01660 [Acidimicrobiia bacterium]
MAETRQLYVCVYRRHIPTAAQWRSTVQAADGDPRLRQFLDEYWRKDRYFDWGDDPAFFAARETFGDPRHASWAVCRPNVRTALREGDGVAFFCGKQALRAQGGAYRPAGPYDYFYVGCGAVGRLVERVELWHDKRLAPYRSFYNTLARPNATGALEQHETFLPYHPNWRDRASSPLVLFDLEHSAFNLDDPHPVAHYEPDSGPPERWRADRTSRKLERLLFDGTTRRLRTSKTGFAHAHRRLRLAERDFEELRDALVSLAKGS